MTPDIKEKVTGVISKVEEMSSEEFNSLIKQVVKINNYSFQNRLLLAIQGATMAASFNKWKELNRFVKAGEKSMFVLAPLVKKIKSTQEEVAQGEEEEKIIIKGFKYVPVFDISQTDGEPIKGGVEMTTDTGSLTMEHLLKVSENLGYTVTKNAMSPQIGGYITEKSIVLNNMKTDTENIGTLIHELAHGTLGHTNELDFISTSQAEQEAETLTALICADYGVERKSTFYLKSWGTEKIIESLPRISKAYEELKKALQ